MITSARSELYLGNEWSGYPVEILSGVQPRSSLPDIGITTFATPHKVQSIVISISVCLLKYLTKFFTHVPCGRDSVL